MGRVPNAYNLTKAMGEEIVQRKLKDLPVAVYRPSIVANTNKEPVKGWHNSLQGVGAMLIGTGIGVLRTLSISPKKHAELIPVDKCASALVAIPWSLHESRKNGVELTSIYNHVNNRNPVTWGQTYKHLHYHVRTQKLASKYQVWVISCSFEPNRWLYNLKFFFYHLLPLPFFELAEKLQNQPPRLRKVYMKLASLQSMVGDFIQHDWVFEDSNIQYLWSCMSEEDRRLFDLEITTMNWLSYFGSMSKGYGYYVLKETNKDLEQSRRKYQLILTINWLLLFLMKIVKVYIAYRAGVLLCNQLKYYLPKI